MLPPPTQGVKFMAHMWEDLRAEYRPLVFYLITEMAALASWVAMSGMGFKRHRLG